MTKLAAYMEKIYKTIKKHVDIVDCSGSIIYSSDISRVSGTIDNFNCENAVSIGDRHDLYINIDGGSSEEQSLAYLILHDKLPQAAQNLHQFLIDIIDGAVQTDECCSRYGISPDREYVVYCIRLVSREHFSNAYSLVSNSFYDDDNIIVFPYESDIILLHAVEGFDDSISSNARMIRDMINSELYTRVQIGIGNPLHGIINIRKSWEQAVESLKAGEAFNLPDEIFIFRDILPERLISLMPRQALSELSEQVEESAFSELDSELVKTAEEFFKSNLNISDASKALYIHRNTLLYRLDKIKRATGLDIRKFQDAVIFKLGCLIKSRCGK